MSSQPTSLAAALSAWVRLVNRFSLWVIVAVIIGTAAALRYTVLHLGINTDTADMISDELPWRQDFLAFKASFPSLIDNLVVVVDGDTPDLSDVAVRRLAARLSEDAATVAGVYVPDGGPFFDRHALLYLEPEQLARLSDRLAGVQPFLSRLQRNPSLDGLLHLLGDAVESGTTDTADVLRTFLKSLAEAVEAAMQGRYFSLAWQALLTGGEGELGRTRRVLIVAPALDWNEWLPAAPAIESVRSAVVELDLIPDRGVRVRTTGGPALAHEELDSVSRGMAWAAPAALLLVAIVLVWGLRSFRLVVASLVTLLVGLGWTAAFAAWAVGELNLISIAFAVLYVGLGIDYAVHYALRYRELVGAGLDNADALARGAADVGRSLVLCAVTTGIGFYSFLITDFEGVSQLGLISGTGTFISLMTTLTVLPAVLSVFPLSARRAHDVSSPSRFEVASSASPPLRRRAALALAAVLGLASIALVPWARFDRNQLNLREAGTEGIETYQDLVRDGSRSPLTISIVVRGKDEADALVAKLEALGTVRRVVGLHHFVPGRQDEKLARLDELVLILGPLQTVEPRPASKPKTMTELRRLAPRLETYSSASVDPRDRLAASRLETALRALLERLETDPSAAPPLLDRLSESVLGTFAPALSKIRHALQAETFSVEMLPPDLVRRWVASADRYRLEVFPEEDLSEMANMRRFVSQVLSAAPSATDAPVIDLKSGDVVVRAFQQAFACAFVLICVLLWLALRRLHDVLLVLGPLVWAGLLSVASMVVLGIPFNYANVVALPLLLGTGVDSAIHVVARMRGHIPSSGRIMATSTGRAVLVSALTTLCSFGNLALSPHRGTASMGQVLTLGLLWILVATLVLLPAAVASQRRQAF